MRDSNGCILLGTGIMGNQMAVSNSKKQWMNLETF